MVTIGIMSSTTPFPARVQQFCCKGLLLLLLVRVIATTTSRSSVVPLCRMFDYIKVPRRDNTICYCDSVNETW